MKTKEIIKKARQRAEPSRITSGDKVSPVQTSNRQEKLQKPGRAVKLLRARVATAESKLETAREQARQAKRRRKEAKRIARSAQKEVKHAKVGLAEAKQALAEAKAKLAKSCAAARRRKAVPARQDRPVPSAPSPALGSAARVTPDFLPEKASSPIPVQAGSLLEKPNGGIPDPAIPTATTLESGDPS